MTDLSPIPAPRPGAGHAPDPRPVQFPSEGRSLTGSFHAPQGPARAHIVLHGATGVPHVFYRHFAAWCAARGVGVLTYDYRDFGASQAGRMRNSDATFADWATRDQPAAERALCDLAPEGPIWVIGHSLGGLGLAFHRPHPRVARITTIGAGMAHVADHPWHYRPKALAFWYGPGPLATAAMGYMPGRRLGLGADLPAGVYWQWRRWCTRRDFFDREIGHGLPAPNYDLGRVALRMLAASDDALVPPDAVRRYADRFAPSQPRFQCLRPGDYGLDRLGHIEALSRHAAPAWPTMTGLVA